MTIGVLRIKKIKSIKRIKSLKGIKRIKIKNDFYMKIRIKNIKKIMSLAARSAGV